MCDFSGRLVAWMDGELAEAETAEVGRHVQACADCRERVSACEEVSRRFAAYYDAATRNEIAKKTARKLPRWVTVAVAAAAAVVLLLALLPRSEKQVPAVPQVAVAHPPIAEKITSEPLQAVQRKHIAAHRKAPSANWAMAQPAIQIAIPADAMFPPGAVPQGVNYIASVSLADGSVQAIRLQP